MPSWWVHRHFAHKLGLNIELSRIVDEIIDFAHILPNEYETPCGIFRFPENVEKRHDWVKDYPVEAGKAFKIAFGIEAVKAMMLHMCLDYVYENFRWCIDKNIKFDIRKSLERLNEFLKRFKDTEFASITSEICDFILDNAEEIREFIEVDIDPSRVVGRCEVCGNVSNNIIRCDRCGHLFPGWLWIVFLEEIRELKDRVANPIFGVITFIDRENETLTIRLFSEPKDFDEGTIIGCVVGNRVERIGRIIHFDKTDNEITVDFSEINLPEWLKENSKIKVANAENLIGYHLQQAWIFEAQRNFRGLYEIIAEILKSSLTDESKRELKESLEIIIRNAKKAIDVLTRKGKESVNPSDLKDVKSLSGFDLDNSQINVVRQILGLKDGQILIVVGPPGTGKTEVIAKAAYELVKKGEKILITSHTNIAVDNALEKLADKDLEIVRVGRPEKISDKLKKVMLSKVRYEKAPSDLVDEIRRLEKEIRILKEKVRELKDLRKELREIDRSRLYDIVQNISEALLSSKNREIINAFKIALEADIELKNIKRNIDEIGRNLPEWLRNHLRGMARYYGNNISSITRNSIEKKYVELWVKYFRLKFVRDHYLNYLKSFGLKITKKSLEDILSHEIKKKTKELIDKKKELRRLLELAEKYALENANVVGSTIIRSHIGTLFDVTFDTVIIDECSQISIPLGLMGLIKGKKWVVIGDHLQLLPIFKNIRSDDTELYSNLSFFNYLKNKFGYTYLSVHYRSLPDIIEFSREHIYRDEGLYIEIDKDSGKVCEKLENLLSSVNFLKYPVVFIDVAGKCKVERESRSVYNEKEVEVIKEIVETLKDLSFRDDQIGIITPYVAQARRLREAIGGGDIEINTVDSFQGREKDVIIFSVTGTDKNRINFASHPNRLNVALTRAKCRLIVVGNSNAIRKSKTKLSEFLNWVMSKGYLFDWNSKRWIREGLFEV